MRIHVHSRYDLADPAPLRQGRDRKPDGGRRSGRQSSRRPRRRAAHHSRRAIRQNRPLPAFSAARQSARRRERAVSTRRRPNHGRQTVEPAFAADRARPICCARWKASPPTNRLMRSIPTTQERRRARGSRQSRDDRSGRDRCPHHRGRADDRARPEGYHDEPRPSRHGDRAHAPRGASTRSRGRQSGWCSRISSLPTAARASRR